jgi:hypothetical protein
MGIDLGEIYVGMGNKKNAFGGGGSASYIGFSIDHIGAVGY